ncbi:MAG: hypothetical protein AAB740_02100, partial [Patescibacteria group bacterium]
MTSQEIKENNYIPLSEAAQKYTDYSQEYLSLRARQGKLKAVKIGRNWLTKKEWVEEYLINASSDIKLFSKAKASRLKKSTTENLKLFSLSEMEKYSGYSQEYLSLRARQGKLKAVKIGRNWLIAQEWIDEYKNKKKVAGGFFSRNLANNFYFVPQLLKKQSAVLAMAAVLIFCSAGLVFGFSHIDNLRQTADNFFQKEKQLARASLIDTISVTEDIENYLEVKVKENIANRWQVIDSIATIQKEFKERIDKSFVKVNQLFDQAIISYLSNQEKILTAWLKQSDMAGQIILSSTNSWQAGLENKINNYQAVARNNWQDNWRAIVMQVNRWGDQLASNIENFSANLLQNSQQGIAWLMINPTDNIDKFSLSFLQNIKFFTALTAQSLRATSQIAWDGAQISGNVIGDKIVEGIGEAASALRSLTYNIYNRTSEGLAAGYEFITSPWRAKTTQQLSQTPLEPKTVPISPTIATSAVSTSSANEMIAQLVPKEI